MKNERREVILKLISEKALETQEDLINELSALGFEVTQSTVSRDIKQLGLVKVLDKNGRYKYAQRFTQRDVSFADKDVDLEHLLNIFRRSVISVRYAVNDVVIKCYSGMAQSTCVALDNMFHDMFLGTIAGEDTVFVITENEEAAISLSKKLLNIME